MAQVISKCNLSNVCSQIVSVGLNPALQVEQVAILERISFYVLKNTTRSPLAGQRFGELVVQRRMSKLRDCSCSSSRAFARVFASLGTVSFCTALVPPCPSQSL